MGIPLSLMLGETTLIGTKYTLTDSYAKHSMSALKHWFQDSRPHIVAI